MKIKGNFIIDKYKITGFHKSEDVENKIAVEFNKNLIYEFDKSKTYEFIDAMLGKGYLVNAGYDKARFEDEYQGKEISILRGTCYGQVAFILKENNMFENIVGLSGVDEFGDLIAEDTSELFTYIDSLHEENVETL